MVRTQIYLTEKEKESIKSVAILQGLSQSEFIRKAIDELLLKTSNLNKPDILNEIAGIWSDRNDLPNIKELRAGWKNR